MAKQLSTEQMSAVIEKMIERDLIPQHIIDEATEENPDCRVIDAAELLHSLLCTEQHGMELEDCKHHAESMYPDPRKNPYHRRWIAYTELLLEEYKLEVSDIKALMAEIIELTKLVQNVGDLYTGRPIDFLLDAVSSRLPPLPPVQTAL